MSEHLFLAFVRRVIFSFLLIVMVAYATHTQGQTNGTVGIATKEVTVFTAQGATLSSGGFWQCNNSPIPIQCPVFPDMGAGCQFLSYQTSGFAGTLTYEWTPPGTATVIVLEQASYAPAAPDTANHVLQLGGYFPNLRSTVTPSAGSLSAQYTASAAPCPLFGSGLGTNGPSSPINCDQLATQSVASGSQTVIGGAKPVQAGDVVVICAFSLSFNGATVNGTLQISYATSIANCAANISTVTWNMFTTANTPQTFAVPQQVRSTQVAQQYPCLVNASGAVAYINISWASVHIL
jgi:hypothetical protein